MGTDNLSGIKSNNIVLMLFLLPGRIIQWFLYIFVAGKGYGKVRMQSRLARSPIMTYIYSILSWIVIIYFVSDYFGFLDVFLKYADTKNKDQYLMNGSTLPIFMKRKDYLSVGGWDIMYPSPHVVDWDFFLKCSKHFQMWRTYNTHFYHFAGASTRKTPEQDVESTNKERSAHEFAKLKWGSYIKHNPKNNLKYI